MMTRKLKVLGVCGAQGALLFPFRKNLVANIEPRGVFHTPNEEQWKSNFKEIPFLRKLEDLEEKNIDVIIGSPSCGHSSMFSYSRKKTLGKPKEDRTLNLYLDSVIKLKPKFFLMENLPKLLELIPLSEWQLKLKNYKLITHCHSVSVFGNSQVSRKRLILIGVRDDLKIDLTNFSLPSLGEVKILKTKELYKNVREELNYREDDSKKLAMYHYKDSEKKTLNVKKVEKLWKTEFKNEYKWPVKTKKMKTLPGVYRNHWDKYPLTLRPSNRQFNPDGKIMGLEEFRVIMGFPKKFKIYFNESKRQYWINKGRNTLSKGSVYEVGIWFKKCLKSKEFNKINI